MNSLPVCHYLTTAQALKRNLAYVIRILIEIISLLLLRVFLFWIVVFFYLYTFICFLKGHSGWKFVA